METPENEQPDSVDPQPEPTPEENLFKAIFGDEIDDDDDPEIEVEQVVVDISDPASLKEALEGVPDVIKKAITKMISKKADSLMDEMLTKVNADLDKYADELRQATSAEGIKCPKTGKDHEPMTRKDAVRALMHWLTEEQSRTNLACLVGGAVARITEYQDLVFDLETQLAGYQHATS